MNTKVFLESLGKHHSLYDELLSAPPNGFSFVTAKGVAHNAATTMRTPSFTKMMMLQAASGVFPPTIAASVLATLKPRPEDCRLTYAAGHLILRDENWVIDCEHLGQIVGYNSNLLGVYHRTIERILERDSCKRILPWSRMAKRTFEMNLHSRKVLDKIEVVPLARRSTELERHQHDRIRILFVGSINFPAVLRPSERAILDGMSRLTGHCAYLSYENFHSKGGLLAVEAFSRIANKHPDVELVIRSYVPSDIVERCRSIGRIRIIADYLPHHELQALFSDSDIFLFPSHMTPGMAFLDAMNYELPIVTIGACNNSEYVIDSYNGVVCGTSRSIPYWYKNGLPAGASYEHMKAIQSTDPDNVKELADAVSHLVENRKERVRLGANGKRMLTEGQFSIRTRNERLRVIFEEAMRK